MIDEVARIMAKAEKLDLSRYGYRIASYDEDEKISSNGVTVYIESINKENRFNAMYSGSSDEGWSYYYDEREGFLGGWMDIDPTDLINLIKITNYLSSGI